MVNDVININETADIVAHMGVVEQAVIIRVIPTRLLIDELSNRYDNMEYKLNNILELLDGSI